jgi:hypothetical protein
MHDRIRWGFLALPLMRQFNIGTSPVDLTGKKRKFKIAQITKTV